jgi:modulator of FtsH protease
MNNRLSTMRSNAMTASTVTTVIDNSARRVLRNTYFLLSLTLGFSALTAGVTAALHLPHPGILITLAGYFGLLFLVNKFRDSGTGVALVFALTGFMGYTLGPIISRYLGMANGTQTVMLAVGGTAAIFLGLSAYALVSKRDFSFMRGFPASWRSVFCSPSWLDWPPSFCKSLRFH